MGWTQPVAALGTDGLTAWRDVFASVERHMAGQQEVLAGLAVALLVLAVFIGDVWLARWLLRRRSTGSNARRL